MEVVSLPSTSSIGFDDVSTTTGAAKVPNGYHGLNWKNFKLVHCSFSPGSGYDYGIVSGNYVAVNLCAKPCSISSATPFSVAGFQVTAARRNALKVLVQSFDENGKSMG